MLNIREGTTLPYLFQGEIAPPPHQFTPMSIAVKKLTAMCTNYSYYEYYYYYYYKLLSTVMEYEIPIV
jgi:hypothetical protein